jgi:phage terminase large subunit
MLDVSKAVFDQSEQRCRKFWWGDYNPKVTDHWVFNNVEPRKDVGFLKTTFRDNPRVSDAERGKIESYEPTPENIAQGTADDYLWNVYGLGLRSAPEGLIFQNVNWITEFPKDLERVFYGLDFGYTNSPSALVKVGVGGRDMYVECLFYSPTESPTELIEPIREHCGKSPVWADPSGRGMIAILRREGLNVLATNTFPGSIKTGLALMKTYRQNWVRGHALVKEQANYKYRTLNGKPLDDPIDDFNHAIDAARMPVISNLRIGATLGS